jgi:hypothetical protein
MYEIAKEASNDDNLMVSFLVGEYGKDWIGSSPTSSSSTSLSAIKVWPLPGGGDTIFTATDCFRYNTQQLSNNNKPNNSNDDGMLPLSLRNSISNQFRMRRFTRTWDPYWLNVTSYHCNSPFISPHLCSSLSNWSLMSMHFVNVQQLI